MVDRANLAIEAEARAVDRIRTEVRAWLSWGGPLQNLWTTVSEPYEIILVLRCITNYKVAFPVTLTGLDTIQLRTTSHFVEAVRRATFRDEGNI
jgi:hypothetical protein